MNSAGAKAGAEPPRASRREAWWLAIRPKTLSLALVPVVVGSILAWTQGADFSTPVFVLALTVAVLIQIGTNLFNDAGDFERGADRAETRVGPLRVTAAGLLRADQVRGGARASFATAFLLGVGLIWVGGWPIALAGGAALAAGWAYTSGPRPLAYGPWGEVFVLTFFGVVAVVGSHYLQSGRLDPAALLSGVVLGLPAAAVLAVNNTRDRDSDAAAGRRTLAVQFGPPAAARGYALLLWTPFVLSALLMWLPPGGAGVWLPWLLLPAALGLARRFARTARGAEPAAEFNRLLAATARFQIGFGALMVVGFVLGAR